MELIKEKLEILARDHYLNLGITEDHYSISGIKDVKVLAGLLLILSCQDEYEIFVETERNTDIEYYVAGERRQYER